MRFDAVKLFCWAPWGSLFCRIINHILPVSFGQYGKYCPGVCVLPSLRSGNTPSPGQYFSLFPTYKRNSVVSQSDCLNCGEFIPEFPGGAGEFDFQGNRFVFYKFHVNALSCYYKTHCHVIFSTFVYFDTLIDVNNVGCSYMVV